MSPTPQLRGLTLVLIGEFNPTIFHPRWFASEGLLTDEEASTANVQVVHSDVTVFQLPWIQLVVERQRMQASCTAQPYFDRVVETCHRTLEILRHTPISSLGINNEAHFKASSEQNWHELGHKLAPKELWANFFPSPGMQSLTIRQAPRMDEYKGYVQVAIEPSARIKQGVYLGVNDHFECGESLGATLATSILQAKWATSVVFAEDVYKRIVEDL
jgi:hypothetical protein